CAASPRRESLHFQDVSLLVLERGCHLIKRFLRILAQRSLAGTEADFRLRDRLILIQLAHRLLDTGNPGISRLRCLLSLGRAVARLDSVLIGFIRLAHGTAYAFSSARVNV